MSELRVLQFVNILDRGGTESFIFNNLREMDREKINFDFLLTRNQKEEYDAVLIELGCKKIIIMPPKCNKIIYYFRLYENLKEYFSTCNYSIVHFENNPPGIMATASVIAARNAGIPIRILHSHSSGGEKKSYNLLRPLITAVCRMINTKSCNAFLAPTKLAAEYGFGCKLANSKHCNLICNAIDREKYLFDPLKREYYRQKLGLLNYDVFGTVGRLSEVKNHKWMLKIFAEIQKRHAKAKLLIVGGEVTAEPKVRDELMQMAFDLNILDNVIFFGQTDDIAGLLSSMDVFLITSRTEAFGIAAVEAQVCGLNVIAASDGIPTEMDVTGNVKWLSLLDPELSWVTETINHLSKTRNSINFSSPNLAKIDIKETAQQLTNIYIELLKKTTK